MFSVASKKRFLCLLGAALTILQLVEGEHRVDDDSCQLPITPESPTPAPIPASSMLVILANGDRILLNAEDGTKLWHKQQLPPVIEIESNPSGTPITFGNIAAVPSLDGNLYELNINSIQVSIKALHEKIRSGFRTRDGSTLHSQEQTKVYLLNQNDGSVILDFEADLDHGLSMTEWAGILFGQVRYTISCQTSTSPWRLSYTETVALSDGQPVLSPDLFVTSSGCLLARDPVTGDDLWHQEFSSFPAFALVILEDGTFRIPIRYCEEIMHSRSPLPARIISHLSHNNNHMIMLTNPQQDSLHSSLDSADALRHLLM